MLCPFSEAITISLDNIELTFHHLQLTSTICEAANETRRYIHANTAKSVNVRKPLLPQYMQWPLS